MKQRVVITGLGVVSPFGAGILPLWEGLVAGRSGLRPISRFDPSALETWVGGEVRDFSARDHMPKSYRKAIKVMAWDTELAVGAARLAFEDARLLTRFHAENSATQTTYPGERVGCQIGAGLISAETAELAAAMATAVDPGATPEEQERRKGFSLRAWGTAEGGGGGMGNLPPLWMLKYLPNMLACHVTIIHGCEGPSNTLTCGEASGLLCIGEGARVIERGGADATISGGAESKLNHMSMLRCRIAGHLASVRQVEDGIRAVRPFDPDSEGTVIGEGGGLLVLEEAEHARSRGARAYAEVAGFGAGQSSASRMPPLPASVDGDDGLAGAIEAALGDAGVSAGDVDLVVAQGIGIPAFDLGEGGAIARVLGARAHEIPALSLAPYIGNLYAGHGGVQAAVGAMCLHEQRIPARLHGGRPSCVRAEAGASRDASLRHVLLTSVGTGGQSAAMILRAVR
jgi:3-oxoacyl-[acyl-carrier-protein] synthase II